MNIVQQNQAASQSQTGFYSWFQMPCGTSGTAGNPMLYVLGNYFEAEGCSSGCMGVPRPAFLHVTALDFNTLQPINNNSLKRWQFGGFDYLWGLQTLQTASGGGDLLVSGMLNNYDAACAYDYSNSGSLYPSRDNYNPFFMDLSIDYDVNVDTIMIHPNFTKTYMSREGTGTNSLSNSYHAINNWMYNNTWSANNACRRSPYSSNQRLALTAPVWDDNNTSLAFKMIQTNLQGDLNVCTNDYTACTSPDFMNYIENINQTTFTSWNNMPPIIVASISNAVSTDNPSIYDCINGFYRTTATSQATIVKIAPNPAKDYIDLKLNGKVSQMKITLSDLTGRTITTIFDGATDEFSIHLLLPSIVDGLYFANIELNGSKLPSQKLIIIN